jgi:hypothetical protein
MIVKARRAAAFLPCYSQTSLPEVKIVSTLHAWSILSFFIVKHVCCLGFFFFFFLKKKKKRGGIKDAELGCSIKKFPDILCMFN